MKRIIIIIALAVILLCVNQLMGQQVVHRFGVRGKARVDMVQGRPVISVGAIRAKFMSPAAYRFVIQHEKAHVALGHFNQRGSKSLRQMEAEADSYAYRNISQADQAGARRWARWNGGTSHGSGRQRANR